ncbi:ArsR family transcriptional regulator [Pseudomonas sp. TE3786]
MTPTTLFKCLADETRLRAVLLIVREGELCVCELMSALEGSQPKVSRHLAQLRANGLLLDRRQGLWVYYRLNPQLPDWALAVLTSTLEGNGAWLEGDLNRLQHMSGRPLRSVCC